ncbi:aldolase/citrate lyase family protein [Roseomonas sp. OT10]|uniref:HpcH/HpaI aldolase family protein n=1 Tax=Roseomonas cutis TaxID=2897332 RepID=UPI001E39C870|nr:aldolase/citrate lyase family protein [Roseomonas sp. OT10]UFN47672.1 aldolase/citrate lyase family protein [Roseomonas sp. OT10]
MSGNLLKERLLAGRPCHVFGVRLARSVNIVTLARQSGHHGLYVDLQHSTMTAEAAAQICHAAMFAGVTAFVRVPTLDPGLIGRLLDGGAQGILAPGLRTGAEAEALVRSALLPPRGERSPGLVIDPRVEGLSGAAQLRAVNDATLLIAMIEDEAAIAQAGAIASVDGIDAVQIGGHDLTTSMGLPGEYLHPRVQEAFRAAIAACRPAGKPLIIGGIRKPEEIAVYLRMGAARCYFTGSDIGFVQAGARAAAERVAALDADLFAPAEAR